MATKILILVEKGTVSAIHSTDEDLQICIVDYDNVQVGKPPINEGWEVLQPDTTFEPGSAHEIFTDASDPVEMEIRDILKSIHY
jgi:hypothetical protein